MHPSAHIALGLVLGSVALAPATMASSLDAYTLSAGGGSSCVTFGPDPLAAPYGRTIQVGLPSGGACSVGVDSHAATGSGGSLQAASALAVGFGAPGDVRSFVGSAASRAAYGNLGVSAAASYGGSSDALTVAGSQAGARQVETMTFGLGSGNGTYRPTFTIDGSFFSVGRTDSEIEFDYAAGGGPTFLAFRLLDTQGTLSLYANGGYQASLPGMTVTGDAANGFTVAGSTTFTLDIPIVFGTAIDVTYSLWAASVPRSNVGLLTPSAGDASFLNTVRLTGIQVLDAAGRPLDSFSITAASGTLYGPGGVLSAVPEPGAWMLMAVGVLMLTLRRRRRVGRH